MFYDSGWQEKKSEMIYILKQNKFLFFFQFLRFDDLLSKNLPFDDDDDDHLLSKRKKKAILLKNSNVIVGLQ